MKRSIFMVVAMTTAAVLGMFGAVTPGIGAQPGLAATESSPWFQTNSNAALSRANLTEKALNRTTVTKIKYLRSVVAPPQPPKSPCLQGGAVALAGGYLYALTTGKISKYNAATGRLIWRSTPSQDDDYVSLAVSHNLVIAGGAGCVSESEPSSIVYAFNASTGALVWSRDLSELLLTEAVVAGSYIITAGATPLGSAATVLNIADGTLVWSSPGCGYRPSPVVVNSLVMSYGCSQTGSETLDARHLATGALAWSLPGRWLLQRGDQSGANGKHLYATDPSGTVVDLNSLTGQAEYTLSQAATVLAVDSSRVYATCGSHHQDLCGYDIGTGALAWQDTQLLGTPKLAAEADGILYLDYGSALNTATGKRITRIWTSGGTALAVGDGRIANVTGRIIDLYGLQGY
jgi:outer membrane protein assembly factor BamB